MENLMSDFGEKAMEIIQAGWPGVAAAVIFWSVTRFVKWAVTPAPLTNEQKLYNLIVERLESTSDWKLAGGQVQTLDGQIRIHPDYNLVLLDNNSLSPTVLGGKKKLRNICKLASKVHDIKTELKRRLKVREAIASLSTPVVEAVEVVDTSNSFMASNSQMAPNAANVIKGGMVPNTNVTPPALPAWLNPAVVDMKGNVDLSKVVHPHNLFRHPEQNPKQ